MICEELNDVRLKELEKDYQINSKKCQPERLNPETCNYREDIFPPPWNINEHPEKTEGWVEFQRAMKKNPEYYKMR